MYLTYSSTVFLLDIQNGRRIRHSGATLQWGGGEEGLTSDSEGGTENTFSQ